MKITQIRIFKPSGESGRVVAFCSLIFDDVFAVHNIKLLKGDKGYYLLMPAKKGKDGKMRDLAHPLMGEFREHLLTSIVNEFERV